MTGLVTTEHGADGVFRLTLSGPRANALEPGILADMDRALDALAASGARRAIVAGGCNFSTGGDVAGFYRACVEGEAKAYANKVVPLLQRCLFRMVEMPVIFAVAARGAVTGGSAGFLFASDLAVLAPDVFVQPYYTRVGFAPDGGWPARFMTAPNSGRQRAWVISISPAPWPSND